MGAMKFEKSLELHIGAQLSNDQVQVEEEIEGLIKVYRSGYVERPLIVPHVSPSLAPNLNVEARDYLISRLTNVWARIYVPKVDRNKLPLLVYFHGGGFCVGSAAWECYHDFLASLSSEASCIIMSVNYRLAPENRLPAAYDDGFSALMWLKKKADRSQSSKWWTRHCNFSSIFLGGDSAGANLAYNVALKLKSPQIRSSEPLNVKGVIMIQPFIGGEERTNSEKTMVQSRRSPLTLPASDTYWRLALPYGANRDHPWCNPFGNKRRKLEDSRIMVCIAEKDVLRDRNLEMCSILADVGNKVEPLISKGVGHAFQILGKCQISQIRRQELITHITAFIRG